MSSIVVACGVSRGCTFGDTRKGSGGMYLASTNANGAPEWEEDASVTECRGCQSKFSLLVRKHHCRHCGKIFCAQCCREKRPLPKFDYMRPVRVCRSCAQKCWKAESLLLAIRGNNLDLVSRYVRAGKDCNFYTGVFPPLTIAASLGHCPEMVRLLLQGKADVNYQVPPCVWFEDQLQNTDHVGVTALHAAVQANGNTEVLQVLLEGKADINARTHKGNTALLFACNAGLVQCAQLLVKHGARVNAQNSTDGDSPLHRAVREGHVECVTLLLQHGANAQIVNSCDLTALQLADRLRQRSVMDELSRAIALPPLPPHTAAPRGCLIFLLPITSCSCPPSPSSSRVSFSFMACLRFSSVQRRRLVYSLGQMRQSSSSLSSLSCVTCLSCLLRLVCHVSLVSLVCHVCPPLRLLCHFFSPVSSLQKKLTKRGGRTLCDTLTH